MASYAEIQGKQKQQAQMQQQAQQQQAQVEVEQFTVDTALEKAAAINPFSQANVALGYAQGGPQQAPQEGLMGPGPSDPGPGANGGEEMRQIVASVAADLLQAGDPQEIAQRLGQEIAQSQGPEAAQQMVPVIMEQAMQMAQAQSQQGPQGPQGPQVQQGLGGMHGPLG